MKTVSERAIVLLIAAVQFVNVLDFVMVMPLGPDFALALDIAPAHLGYIGGSYTAAAAVSGLAGAFFLDRFDRRKALAVSMLGLVIGTAAGGLATGFSTLIAARVFAGLFGGPATSLAFSIIADVVPVERRGRAVGTVMSAFSIASILGVPAGLELARVGGWRMPFFVVGGLGLIVAFFGVLLLPPLRGHLEHRGGPEGNFGELLRRPQVLVSYSLTAAVMMASFLLIPNISAYVQQNLGYPRAALGLLYLFGGVVSLFTLRLTGQLVDKHGSFRVGTVGAAVLLLVTFATFIVYDPLQAVMGPWFAGLEGRQLSLLGLKVTLTSASIVLPIILIFLFFFLAMGIRNVAYNTLTSKVPNPRERARFMSLQSAVQHLAAAVGAFLSARILVDLPGGKLGNVSAMASISMGLTLLAPPLMWWLERWVRAHATAQQTTRTAPIPPPGAGIATPPTADKA